MQLNFQNKSVHKFIKVVPLHFLIQLCATPAPTCPTQLLGSSWAEVMELDVYSLFMCIVEKERI